jgi:hypothetical protein
MADELEAASELLDLIEDNELETTDELSSAELDALAGTEELVGLDELAINELAIAELAIAELATEDMTTGAELATTDELAMDDELNPNVDELAAALLSGANDELLASDTLVTEDETSALLASDDIATLLAATDADVGEGAAEPPPPPPQPEIKPKTDKVKIVALTRMANPAYNPTNSSHRR